MRTSHNLLFMEEILQQLVGSFLPLVWFKATASYIAESNLFGIIHVPRDLHRNPVGGSSFNVVNVGTAIKKPFTNDIAS